jgi:hypothetical protein
VGGLGIAIEDLGTGLDGSGGREGGGAEGAVGALTTGAVITTGMILVGGGAGRKLGGPGGAPAGGGGRLIAQNQYGCWAMLIFYTQIQIEIFQTPFTNNLIVRILKIGILHSLFALPGL